MPDNPMSLTPDLVARVPPFEGTAGRLSGRTDLATEEEWNAAADELLGEAPESGEVWIFAYGSLIWNPEFDVAEERLGTIRGWQRSFCQGWVRIYRGTPTRPGLMLALDHGESCQGVIFRLPQDAIRENLMKILRREMPIKWQRLLPRWVTVETKGGPVRAIVFPVDHESDHYLEGLETEVVVEALATAAGERGSMAEYLYNTITHLAGYGIHDSYLWEMQELVARRIASGPPHLSDHLLSRAETENGN